MNNWGYKKTGCYSTFDTFDDFVKIDPEKYPKIYDQIKPFDDDFKIDVTAYENDKIVAMWWWDGDGDLIIWIKGEKYAYQNTDCKCHYDWCEIEVE
jgi:restriction endonuclease S subunit